MTAKDASTQTLPFKASYHDKFWNQDIRKNWDTNGKFPEIDYVAMRSENRRLLTFTCVTDRKKEFAKSGFFSVYSGDVFQCAFCKLMVADWECWGENITKEHNERKESCRLARKGSCKLNIAPIFETVSDVPKDFIPREPFNIHDYLTFE